MVGDRLIPMGRPDFEKIHNIKTVVLVLQLTRLLCSTGKSVIIDDGFFVLKILLEMRKKVFMEVN